MLLTDLWPLLLGFLRRLLHRDLLLCLRELQLWRIG